MAGLFNADTQLEALLERQRQQNVAQQQQFGQLFGAAAGNRRQAAVNTIGAQIGASFGQGLAGGLLGESDEVKKARELVEQEKSLQQRLGNLNPDDPSSYLKIGQELNRAGLTKEGIAFMEQGQALSKAKEEEQKEVVKRESAAQSLRDSGFEEIANQVDLGLVTPEKGIEMSGKTTTLSPGEILVNQETGKTVAQGPAKEASGFNLGPGEVRYDSSGKIIAMRPESATSRTTKKIETVNATGARVQQLVDSSGNVVAEFDAPPVDWTDEDNKMYDGFITTATDANATSRLVNSTLNVLGQVDDFSGGFRSKIVDAAKNVSGFRDSLSEAKTLATRLRNSQIIAELPPGVASDADIALIKAGFPPDDAGKTEWVNYLNSLKKVSEAAATYSNEKANFFARNNKLAGFNQYYELNSIQDGMAALKPLPDGSTAYDVFESLSPQEKAANRQNFIDTHGFDPMDVDARVNKLTSELSSMGINYGR